MNLKIIVWLCGLFAAVIAAGCSVPSTAPNGLPGAIPSQFGLDEAQVFSVRPKPAVAADWTALLDLQFAGTYRRDAKTSFAVKGSRLAPFESFESVKDLVQDLAANSPEETVKTQYHSRTGHSLVAKDNNEARMPVEMRNARLTGYIRAVKWVANEDQDFHVMVCERPAGDGQPCFTTEVSGLPKNGVRTTDFRRARTELITVLRDYVDANEAKPLTPAHIKDKWAFFEPGVHVEVSGSLYLDAIHGPGTVGPRPGAKQTRNHTTPTSWEIHPVWSVRHLEE